MKCDKNEVCLEFDLPGFSRDDMKIKIVDNMLSIHAERKIEKKIQRNDFFHDEYLSNSFNYSTTLPSVDSKGAHNSFQEQKTFSKDSKEEI